jgi:hypothetical protein
VTALESLQRALKEYGDKIKELQERVSVLERRWRLEEDQADWRGESEPDELISMAELMRRVILPEVSGLWAKGEEYPVVVVVDDSSRQARRLKCMLPAPPGNEPHNPGLFAAYPHALARRCLQDVLGRGYLLDSPHDAPPGKSFWHVEVLGKEGFVDLVTVEDGNENTCQRVEFKVRS